MDFLDTSFLWVGGTKYISFAESAPQKLKDLKVHLHGSVMKKNPFSPLYEETAKWTEENNPIQVNTL